MADSSKLLGLDPVCRISTMSRQQGAISSYTTYLI